MKHDAHKRFGCVLLLFLLLFLLASCGLKSGLVGRWKEVGKAATIEFSKDGSFKAVDNEGMAVSGTYALSKDGQLRCAIKQTEGPAEIVNVNVLLKGDDLTLTSSDKNEVEHYRRVK